MSDDDDIQDDGFLTGRILIASPTIGDPRFDKSVIFLCAHESDHAMGLILNKPMYSLRLPMLLEQLGVEKAKIAPDKPVLAGGPVEKDRGFVLHTCDYLCPEGTLPIAAGIGLTATREMLDVLPSADAPRRALMALGYAGWESGQLEDEIQANAWLVTEPDEGLIFDDDHGRKWERALHKLGVAPSQLIGSAGHA
ncbi:YqgE/AlgH family protein [Woodsholea maritima]|uniref:YqgE/AlgH family protein n=1 Tax=Woodsholea maritima TaxID=240237 RepID=UPI00035C49FA|nr:YqgE/AlgH family protein [Woodsholea maritima]